MPYDRTTAGSGPLTPGWGGRAIDLASGDFEVSDSVKAIVLTSAGNVVCSPANATANITLSDLPAGYILPWHCSHIRQAGTTASLATVTG